MTENKQGIHVLTVSLTFKDSEQKQRFRARWSGLADIVRREEPDCLSYVWLDDQR